MYLLIYTQPYLFSLASASNLHVINQLEVLLICHQADLPVVEIEFVSSASLKYSVELLAFTPVVLAVYQAGDLSPLLLR